MKIVGSEPKFQSCFNTPSKREMKAGHRREALGAASGTIFFEVSFYLGRMRDDVDRIMILFYAVRAYHEPWLNSTHKIGMRHVVWIAAADEMDIPWLISQKSSARRFSPAVATCDSLSVSTLNGSMWKWELYLLCQLL